MPKYSLKAISSETLDAHLSAHVPEANFLQSSAWGRCFALCDTPVFYLGLFNGDRLKAVLLAILRSAKRGRYLEIPGGPMLDWQNESPALLRALLDGLRAFATAQRCVFVRMRPNLPDDPALRTRLKTLGLQNAPMQINAQDTLMLDLAPSEAELLAGFRRQTRYDARKAEKLGIKVTVSHAKSDFEAFCDLQRETAKRQGFITFSRRHLLAERRAFGKSACLYTASLDGKILARALILMSPPEAIYHEAASSPENRRFPGACALLWRAIRDAKALGCARFNFFGVAPANAPHHRYAGVTTFKAGFGGRHITYLPTQDLVIRPLRYLPIRLLESLRRRHRRL